MKLPKGLDDCLFHLVGVVLGDFPAAVVVMANKLVGEKSRHVMITPVKMTRVSIKAISCKEHVLILEILITLQQRDSRISKI